LTIATINRFEELEIWKRARDICRKIYEYTSRQPFCNDFALVNQMRRSGGSIMDNIAEGFERSGSKEFIHFRFISKASCGECRAQIYRAFDQKYLAKEDFDMLFGLLLQESQQIQSLISYLKKNHPGGQNIKR